MKIPVQLAVVLALPVVIGSGSLAEASLVIYTGALPDASAEIHGYALSAGPSGIYSASGSQLPLTQQVTAAGSKTIKTLKDAKAFSEATATGGIDPAVRASVQAQGGALPNQGDFRSQAEASATLTYFFEVSGPDASFETVKISAQVDSYSTGKGGVENTSLSILDGTAQIFTSDGNVNQTFTLVPNHEYSIILSAYAFIDSSSLASANAFLDPTLTPLDAAYDVEYSFNLQSTAPEPSTWAMMLLGFAGLGYVGYRKSRRATTRPSKRRRVWRTLGDASAKAVTARG